MRELFKSKKHQHKMLSALASSQKLPTLAEEKSSNVQYVKWCQTKHIRNKLQ